MKYVTIIAALTLASQLGCRQSSEAPPPVFEPLEPNAPIVQPDPQMPADDAGERTTAMRGPAETGSTDGAGQGDLDGKLGRAILVSAPGAGITGSLDLEQDGDELVIDGDIRGLSPGEHGFHIHEKGDCSAHDFKSAGGHFAPMGNPHGGPDAARHHAGDLGNLVVGEDGHVHVHVTTEAVDLGDGRRSVIGKAFIVHAGTDDLASQPSGAAGPRVVCGVIERFGRNELRDEM